MGFPIKFLNILTKFVKIQFIPQGKGEAEKCGDPFISADKYGGTPSPFRKVPPVGLS
jgi:hypothetical protein